MALLKPRLYSYRTTVVKYSPAADQDRITMSIRADAPEDVVNHQTLFENFRLRPANRIEILGIATATCLLAFFLCTLLCMILEIPCCASSPSPDGSDISDTMTISGERDERPQPLHNRTSAPLEPSRINCHETQEHPQKPYLMSLIHNTRITTAKGNLFNIKREHNAKITTGIKLAWSKLAQMPGSKIISNRRKDTTLDLEEGFNLRSNAIAGTAGGEGGLTHPDREALRKVSKMEKNGDHSGSSFLPCRTASLGQADAGSADKGRCN
ncbi:hypothetical protein F5Y19DRAFT_126136 [Xylariaceae sp. FL1651]|nr:hypothetical protein F5Y19DRAFT_126136 [Xylariaceae sp. FL1651]